MVTAAHCGTEKTKDKFKVIIGDYNRLDFCVDSCKDENQFELFRVFFQ